MPDYGDQAGIVAVRRLGIYATGVAPDDLTAELLQSAQEITTRFACIKDYDGLQTIDAVWFDTAVGLLSAIRLIAPAVAVTSNGYIKLKNLDFEYTYAAPSAEDQRVWSEEFAQALGNISVIRQSRYAVAAATSVFGVAGRQRVRESNGRYSLARIIESMLPSGWGGDRPGVLGAFPADATLPTGFS